MADSLRRRMMMGQSGSRLPSGYTELQYVICAPNIANRDGSYINTGVKTSATLEVRGKWLAISSTGGSSYRVIYGNMYSAPSQGCMYAGIKTGSAGEWRFGSSGSNVTPTISASTWYESIHNISGVTLNNTLYSYSGASMNQSNDIYLGSIKAIDYTNSSYTAFNGYLGEFQFIDNGKLIGDFLPVKNASNVAGFYDLVSRSFYASLSGTNFDAGPEAEN